MSPEFGSLKNVGMRRISRSIILIYQDCDKINDYLQEESTFAFHLEYIKGSRGPPKCKI